MDYAILLVLTACGLFGSPIHVVIVGAVVLTLLSAQRKWTLAQRYPGVGRSRILVVALVLSLANNTIFSLLSFALGRVVSLLA